MPKKIRELRASLAKAGFQNVRTKGSHQRWVHSLLPEFPLTIAGKDGDDAKRYQEQQVAKALKTLKEREL